MYDPGMSESWDPAAPGVLRLPSGRLVRGRGVKRPLPDGPSPSFGVYLLGWAIFTAYMTVAASQVSPAVFAVFALLTLTFLLLAIAWFDKESSGWLKVGGYVGIVTALAAWYASFAGVTAFAFKRPFVPTGPRA